MAGSYLEPLHSPSELRSEAESLLHGAIRLEARRASICSRATSNFSSGPR
jgi:hypothetical protein